MTEDRAVCGHRISFTQSYNLTKGTNGRRWMTVKGGTRTLTCARTPHIAGTPHEAVTFANYHEGARPGKVAWTTEGRVTYTDHPSHWPVGLLCVIEQEAAT